MQDYDFETWNECFDALYDFFSREIYSVDSMNNYDYYINNYRNFKDNVISEMQEYDVAEEWLDEIDNKAFEDLMDRLKICLNEFLDKLKSRSDFSDKDKKYIEDFWK